MKTYATVLALAAVACARDMPAIVIPTDDEMTVEDKAYWTKIHERNYYSRNAWLGVFQGLYGMSGKIDRPTEDCFGEWIPDKMQELYYFKETAKGNMMEVDMDMAAVAAYDLVDLTFLNDRYCHFRQTVYDVHQYCADDDSCAMGSIMENLQKNAFNVITQVSTAGSIFKQQPWEEMDMEGRGYALNQLGHSIASLYADLIGFNASKVVREE